MTTAKVNKPHVHAECIKAWADGAEIQMRVLPTEQWITATARNLAWWDTYEYRVKPQPATLSYRVALFKDSDEDYYTKTYFSVDIEHLVLELFGFIRWLTPWTTVEV